MNYHCILSAEQRFNRGLFFFLYTAVSCSIGILRWHATVHAHRLRDQDREARSWNLFGMLTALVCSTVVLQNLLLLVATDAGSAGKRLLFGWYSHSPIVLITGTRELLCFDRFKKNKKPLHTVLRCVVYRLSFGQRTRTGFSFVFFVAFIAEKCRFLWKKAPWKLYTYNCDFAVHYLIYTFK